MGNTCCYSCSPCQDKTEISTEIMRALEGMQSMENVEELIAYIDRFLSNTGTGGQEQINKTTSLNSLIGSGGNMIEKLSRRLNCHVCKKYLLSALDRETRRVVFDVLEQAQLIPCLGMALSIMAHLLDRAEQVSSNNDECLRLLRYMSVLAKHMKNLDIHLDRPKLNDILVFIVKETLLCARQMQPNSFCRFISAPLDNDDLKDLETELVHLYPDLQLQALTEVLNRLPIVPRPSQGEYPDDAVDVEEAQNKVIELLDLRDSSRRVVVIYGVGGIGKTTLATAVFQQLHLSGYHHCRVFVDQDPKESHLRRKQEQILRDLFTENLKLNDCTQGREKLSEAFGKASQPVFLFIDNALRQTDLEMLLPIQHLSRLPMQSRILLTTRNLNETKVVQHKDGIQVYSHRVDSVSEPKAERLLCHYALGDRNSNFDRDVNVDDLLQLCGGIPLVLRIVGCHMRADGNSVSACNEIVEYYKKWQQKGFEGGEEDPSERIVDFVYRRLKKPSKEAFFDIAFFFHGWGRSFVANIVGEMELRDLEAAALVTTSEDLWEETLVEMHDIVKARGKKLSEGNRITDRESLSIILGDDQKLQQTKALVLDSDSDSDSDRDELIVEAKQVDLMSRSLRILLIGKLINGECRRAFEDLRVLGITFEDTLPIDISKSSQLVYFSGRRMSEAKFETNKQTSSRLAESFGNLSRLKILEMINFSMLEWLHESFGNLSSLQNLDIVDCSQLERLPDSFGNLSSLENLNMRNCAMLERLPESFGNLSSLKILNMRNCAMLERLPDSFGNLSSLKTLLLDGCEKLCSLCDNFGQLNSLEDLSICNCKRLKTLPDGIVCLTSLVSMKAYRCPELEAKAMDSLVEINSLVFVEMDESPMLIKRWEQIQRRRPLIGAFGRIRYGYPNGEIMSTMFFNDGTRFLHVDGNGQLAQIASSSCPEMGMKVALFFTVCAVSDKVTHKLFEVASSGFQIIYVDMEAEADGSSWLDKRDKRIKEMLVKLPEGSCAWTSSFNKTMLLFGFSLWMFTGCVNTSIVGTSVWVDEEGRRQFSEDMEKILRTQDCDCRRVDLDTLFSPVSRAWRIMGSM